MSDIYGLTLKTLLGHYDHNSSSWKTSEDTLDLDLEKCSPTLPLSGMTQHGDLYALQTSARPIEERDSSFLPTPTVFHTTMHDEPIEVFQARQARSSTGQIGKSTGVALRMLYLPTPTGMNNRETGQCRDWGADLTHGLKCACKPRRIHWWMEN
jgi:hypothetical protein